MTEKTCECGREKRYGVNRTEYTVTCRSRRAVEGFDMMISRLRTFTVTISEPSHLKSSNARTFLVSLVSGRAHNEGNHWHDADRKLRSATIGLQATFERQRYSWEPDVCPDAALVAT